MRIPGRRTVLGLAATVSLASTALAPMPVAASTYDYVQATFTWTRVDAYGTWTGSMAIFGPHGSGFGMLASESLVPVSEQCGDGSTAQITGGSRPGPTATTVLSVDPNLKGASASGQLQAQFFIQDGCTGALVASGSWTKSVAIDLTGVTKFMSSDGSLSTRGYEASGTISFDGVAATVMTAQISRTKD